MERKTQWGRGWLMFGAVAVLLAATCAAIALTPSPALAAKASNGATVEKLKCYEVCDRYDITGDGELDTLQVIPDEEYDYYTDETLISVLVNDECVWSKWAMASHDDDEFCPLDIEVVQLKSGQVLLCIANYSFSECYADVNVVLQYRGNSMQSLLNCRKMFPRKYTYDHDCQSQFSKVSGDTLTFYCPEKILMTGWTEFNVSYKYKSGKLVRTSNFVKPKIGGRYAKARPALKSMTVYKNWKCKSKKFTIKKGQKVKITKMYVKDTRIALQVKVGKRTGWIKCADSRKSKLLAGPYQPPFKGLYWAG